MEVRYNKEEEEDVIYFLVPIVYLIDMLIVDVYKKINQGFQLITIFYYRPFNNNKKNTCIQNHQAAHVSKFYNYQ
jgi:TRAP-type uncharacterized transport system fused permease subunit